LASTFAEAAQIRRIRSLIALGCEVTSFCQRREGGADFTPEWRNIDLGLVRHNDIRGRALGAGAAVRRAMQGWRQLADARLVIARNLDLALIALAARRLAALRAGRRAPPLVYECLDIHDLMTRTDRVGAIMRRAERQVLSRAALLVVSSPGFVQNYLTRCRPIAARWRWSKTSCGWVLTRRKRPPRPVADARAPAGR
jgi:succinoglycan biosynthesis protein ExoL